MKQEAGTDAAAANQTHLHVEAAHGRTAVGIQDALGIVHQNEKFERPVDDAAFNLVLEDMVEERLQQEALHVLPCAFEFKDDISDEVGGSPSFQPGAALRGEALEKRSQPIQQRITRRHIESFLRAESL